MPQAAWIKVPYGFYLDRILPILGRLLSPNPSAYRYLPDSVVEFPQRADLTHRMQAAGFHKATWDDLTGGTVCLYKGEVK